MHNSYVIQWKNKVNGRAGRGTRQLTREEAQQLAEELNQEYPQILHEPVLWRESAPADNSETAMPARASGETSERQEEEEETSPASQTLPA